MNVRRPMLEEVIKQGTDRVHWRYRIDLFTYKESKGSL